MTSAADISTWHLSTESGMLHLDGVSLKQLAEQFGTPLYVVSKPLLEQTYDVFLEPFLNTGVDVSVFYSFKTNPVPAVLDVLVSRGAGAEVTSEYEFRLAKSLGLDGDRIVVNGTFKSDAYLNAAVAEETALINIESVDELERVQKIAGQVGVTAQVALRVNPGLKGSRFDLNLATAKSGSPMGFVHGGLEWNRALDIVRHSQELYFRGLHVHLGSGISTSSPYTKTLGVIRGIWIELLDAGLQPDVINLGGGFGIGTSRTLGLVEAARALFQQTAPKPPPFRRTNAQQVSICESWQEDLCKPLRRLGAPQPRLILEPGRAISAPAQILLLEVNRIVERKGAMPTAICDGGAMGLSPSLWTEYHAIFVVDTQASRAEIDQRIIGNMPAPIDIVTPCMRLPALRPGDVICVMDTGAYFTSFGNNFAGPRPPIVMVENSNVRLVRRRETFEDMFARDILVSDFVS